MGRDREGAPLSHLLLMPCLCFQPPAPYPGVHPWSTKSAWAWQVGSCWPSWGSWQKLGLAVAEAKRKPSRAMGPPVPGGTYARGRSLYNQHPSADSHSWEGSVQTGDILDSGDRLGLCPFETPGSEQRYLWSPQLCLHPLSALCSVHPAPQCFPPCSSPTPCSPWASLGHPSCSGRTALLLHVPPTLLLWILELFPLTLFLAAAQEGDRIWDPERP